MPRVRVRNAHASTRRVSPSSEIDSLGPEGKGEGVINRRMQFCSSVQEWASTPDQLVAECDHCDQYFAYCCPCASKHYNDLTEDVEPCHHFPIVYVDGACSHNGYGDAVSGIGVSYGMLESHSFSIPVTRDIDSAGPRTSQRAELLAAIRGLETLVDEYRLEIYENRRPEKREWVIITDSEYVTNGITDWVIKWKVSSVLYSCREGGLLIASHAPSIPFT